MRSRSAMSASTRSPARTFVDGFADDPFTRTWPPSHNLVASGRVFTRRTAHSQRSMRVSSVARGSVTRPRMARLERRRGPPTGNRKPDRMGSGFGVSSNWSGREDSPRHFPTERPYRGRDRSGRSPRSPGDRLTRGRGEKGSPPRNLPHGAQMSWTCWIVAAGASSGVRYAVSGTTATEPLASSRLFASAWSRGPLRMVGARDEQGRAADRRESRRQVRAPQRDRDHRVGERPPLHRAQAVEHQGDRLGIVRASPRRQQRVADPARQEVHHPDDAVDREQAPEQEPLRSP